MKRSCSPWIFETGCKMATRARRCLGLKFPRTSTMPSAATQFPKLRRSVNDQESFVLLSTPCWHPRQSVGRTPLPFSPGAGRTPNRSPGGILCPLQLSHSCRQRWAWECRCRTALPKLSVVRHCMVASCFLTCCCRPVSWSCSTIGGVILQQSFLVKIK